MHIEKKRNAVMANCREVVDVLSEPELDAILRDERYFRILIQSLIGMSQCRGQPSDPNSPAFQELLRKSLGTGSLIGR